VAFLLAEERKPQELVFHHYGDSYFLSEVFTEGTETGRRLVPTRLRNSCGVKQRWPATTRQRRL
jgi:hypothetical protein